MDKLVGILKLRLLRHLVFWLILIVFQDFLLINNAGNILNLLLVALIAMVLYTNLFILIPRFLKKARYGKYFLALGFIILAITTVSGVLHNKIFRLYEGALLANAYSLMLFVLTATCLYTFVGSALHLILEWYHMREMEKKVMQAELSRTEAELSALKQQINPHFLFNALNSLYSMSITDVDKTPESILRLSEMMRYMLYKSNVPMVDLQSELQYLNNYLEIQKIRFEGKCDIHYQTAIKNEKSSVAPLLFIHFIENCFKHVNYNEEEAYIDITIRQYNGSIIMKTKNSMGISSGDNPEKIGGIGLDNVQKRLNLIYPSKHQLLVKEETNNFEVELKLEID